MKRKNLLVTGGAGFIGSNLIRTLVGDGYDIYCLDHRQDVDNVKDVISDIKLIRGDVRDRKLLHDLFSKQRFDGVVHLAAVSRVVWGERDPDRCVDINVDGTRNLLDLLSQTQQKSWLIFGSSREVYGEQANFPVGEDASKVPINIYGETKLEGEDMVRRWAEQTDNQSVVLRFSNVYGNEYDILDRVIPRFVLRGLKGETIEIHGGKQLIDFTHIDDTVEGIVSSMEYLENGAPTFEDFHILPGKGTTLQDAVSYIFDELSDTPQVKITKGREYDVDQFVGEPRKARSKLGFRAKIKPTEGISMTIDRFRGAFNL